LNIAQITQQYIVLKNAMPNLLRKNESLRPVLRAVLSSGEERQSLFIAQINAGERPLLT
jgi:hypothetical protein